MHSIAVMNLQVQLLITYQTYLNIIFFLKKKKKILHESFLNFNKEMLASLFGLDISFTSVMGLQSYPQTNEFVSCFQKKKVAYLLDGWLPTNIGTKSAQTDGQTDHACSTVRRPEAGQR